MALNIEQVPGFIETVLKQYVKTEWKDISLPLQEYYCASRMFSEDSLKPMGGPFCEWKLQIVNPGNAQLSGPYAVDTTNRIEMMTHGNAPWSQTTVNYTYDITEEVFKRNAEEIVNHMDVMEHAMLNDYWALQEDLLLSAGPSSPNLVPRPPFSLLWWIQGVGWSTPPTSTTAGTPLQAIPGFFGLNPPGFPNCANIDSTQAKYSGWRNRTFTYSSLSRNDSIQKTIESIDKCNFKPAAPYAELAGGKPKWEILCPYSVLGIYRELLQAGNDNIGNDLGDRSGTCMIRGVPINWVPAWTNSGSINKRTDGIHLGINWSTLKGFYAPGLRMVKRTPYQDKDSHNVRWRPMDDSNQLVCYDRRRNFIGQNINYVTEND